MLFTASLFGLTATKPTIQNEDYNFEPLSGEMIMYVTTVAELDSLDDVSTTLYAIYDLSNPAITEAIIEAHITTPADSADTTKSAKVYVASCAVEDSTLTITQLASPLQTITQTLSANDVTTVQQLKVGTDSYPLNKYLYIYYDASDVTTDYFDITIYLTLH